MRVKRAIYGCIESALLWYDLFTTTLQGMGFKVNDYDRCVATKQINGKQCTICWYVDDNKISHMDQDVIDEVINELKPHFGKLTVTRGNSHTFLGMDIKIRNDGKFEILQKDHLEEAFEMFGEDLTRNVTSPASSDLFQVDQDSKSLDDVKSKVFHSVSAKLLFVMQRSRPDIETAIAFMCSRVSKSTKDDWRKLKRVLQWLYHTVDKPRIIGASSLTELFTWVDAAFAIHPDMRSQTGGCMSFGWGTIHSRSSKQKLNTVSSTEAEIVGVGEYFPRNIHITMFLEQLGYCMRSNVLMQDNQSAIRMERNGKASTTGNSRHVHIRYFFMKDRVDKGEVDLQYCPTLEMLADFFTKPLQGSLFRKFWDVIMGYAHIDTLKKGLCNYSDPKNDTSSLEIKERVGQSNYEKEKVDPGLGSNIGCGKHRSDIGAKTYKNALLSSTND
jgi:hypothetical protein